MIANFFQSLNDQGVEYLLISGQAAVLYGAATFSEDIDLWIDPTTRNCQGFTNVLRSCKSRFYKLTPQLTVENLKRGHGFHFVLPAEGQPDVFLDVMGNPPRLASFGGAVQSSRWIQTEWGTIRTVGIKPLVELKKTQRLEDYPIISKLVLAWFEQPESEETASDLHWGLENIFTLPELTAFFVEHSQAASLPLETLNPALKTFSQLLLSGREMDLPTERQVNQWMQSRMGELQEADRLYWHQIIAELRRLRSCGELMAEGTAV
ncbi:MAG TPA: hypothetical protein VG146_06820 [Verrucomicrobiae bacterium]|nr:hypothetical protein [Verrucomicrobiae bacterium]